MNDILELLKELTQIRMIYLFVTLETIDFIIGTYRAKTKNEYESSIMREGIHRTVFEFFLIASCYLVFKVLLPQLQGVFNVIVAYFLYNEYNSISENLRLLGYDFKGLAKGFNPENDKSVKIKKKNNI